jgi:hypothetical protein
MEDFLKASRRAEEPRGTERERERESFGVVRGGEMRGWSIYRKRWQPVTIPPTTKALEEVKVGQAVQISLFCL